MSTSPTPDRELGSLKEVRPTRNSVLALTVNAVRPRFDSETRSRLEKATDSSEKLFMQLVDVVRLCPVLSRIPDDERLLMEEKLFRVRMPGD